MDSLRSSVHPIKTALFSSILRNCCRFCIGAALDFAPMMFLLALLSKCSSVDYLLFTTYSHCIAAISLVATLMSNLSRTKLCLFMIKLMDRACNCLMLWWQRHFKPYISNVISQKLSGIIFTLPAIYSAKILGYEVDLFFFKEMIFEQMFWDAAMETRCFTLLPWIYPKLGHHAPKKEFRSMNLYLPLVNHVSQFDIPIVFWFAFWVRKSVWEIKISPMFDGL